MIRMRSGKNNLSDLQVYQLYHASVVVDGVEYEGTIKIIRMWTHYDAVR